MTVALYVLANAAIAGAYTYAALIVAPRFVLDEWWGRAGGVGFLVLCGLGTHVLMINHVLTGDFYPAVHDLAVHAVQAVAAWAFVLSARRTLDRRRR